jgi:hypothetical protein
MRADRASTAYMWACSKLPQSYLAYFSFGNRRQNTEAVVAEGKLDGICVSSFAIPRLERSLMWGSVPHFDWLLRAFGRL